MKTDLVSTKISDILVPISRSVPVDPLKEYPLLGIRLDGRGVFHRETKLGSQIAATTLFQVKMGDFIYSRLFAWRGAFGVIDHNLDGYYVSGEFPMFTPIQEKIDIKYLLFWFRLPSILSKIEADCTGSTPLTRNRFKENFFLALEFPLSPLEEQRRIVARIEELAAKIEEARELKKGIMINARKILLGEYGEIIKGAKEFTMGEVAPLIRRSIQIDLSKEYYELGTRSFGKGTFHKPAITGASLRTKRVFRIEADDLLFNNVFAWEGAVAVAKQEDHGRVGSHRFLTCVPKKDIAISSFLCFHFLTERGLQQLGEASPGSAGRNRTLGIKALEETKVPVPPLEKQIWFDKLLAKLNLVSQMEYETSAELDALLPSILDKAFKGELS